MRSDFSWSDDLELDIRFGYLAGKTTAPRRRHPQVVYNDDDNTALRVIREELASCDSFLFSVAFVSPRAIALLLTDLLEFEGQGRIVTSDYLAFNSPKAFAELLRLQRHGIDVRIHQAAAFHPKGYVFEYADEITAMLGSSNLTEGALVKNHEWNLRVSAAQDSDLGIQLKKLSEIQLRDSVPLSEEWVERYAASYRPPPAQSGRVPQAPAAPDVPEVSNAPASSSPLPHADAISPPAPAVLPNLMQREALRSIAEVRDRGEGRALVISATGTGKTILSALDVKAVRPRRLLFVVHREQILDRAMSEYSKVLGKPRSDFGKLSGGAKESDRPFVFSTIQTLSRPDVLNSFSPETFDYILIDEVHRAAADSYRRVLEYFEPRFLLGMTATPERTDAKNIYEMFDYNVAYEIHLQGALEADMLTPFHYFGVADFTFNDGTTTDDLTQLARLVSNERIDHVIRAIETYGQAGEQPRGLIFCSRTHEATEMSQALNERTFRGRKFRTVALTGADSVAHRESAVARLEAGELDYILTVDVFNEGVDIPSINQVVMLRQTQSAIVFVQQLGRGLRKSPEKEYLVVIDFIGNYANNYLIPIALFGDESLNKESIRKGLISAEEIGVLAGLSSVRFDRIAQARVLASITAVSLDAMSKLKEALQNMQDRVGRAPDLWDFWNFHAADPVVLATKREHFPALLRSTLKVESDLTRRQSRALELLSHEVLTAKRPHEARLLKELCTGKTVTLLQIQDLFAEAGWDDTSRTVSSVVDTFTLEHHADADRKRYAAGIVERHADTSVSLTSSFREDYEDSTEFRSAVNDIAETGLAMALSLYTLDRVFTPGKQYTRKEVCRLLGWPRKWTSTLYGYKSDAASGACPIFVTLHKSDAISASTAYEDELIDPTTMLWFTRSRRTLDSREVSDIVSGAVHTHVFVKKDDAEGSDFYYLGEGTPSEAVNTTMWDSDGKPVPVVKMNLKFDAPIQAALFDYFHPVVTSAH